MFMTFPAFESTSVEKETLLTIYLAYTSHELSPLQLERVQVISVLPGNEDHSCDNFQVLYSAVPSALYYFPGKTTVATQAQKVTFPLPPKLEKLQVCKLMPGAWKEAETVHVGCLCINR